MIDPAEALLAKAEESLAGAESEFAEGRYNNCANRSYYTCFQAAVYALRRSGIRPRGREGQWAHDYVQAEFARELIGRRKFYAADLRDVLPRNYTLREAADYGEHRVTEVQASRALRRSRTFVEAVRDRERGTR